MTGPRFAPLKHLPFATLLALLGATGPAVPARADEEPAKPEPAVAQVPNRRGADEIHGLLNLGASLTNRGDYGAAEIAYRQVLNARNTAPVDVKSALLGLAHMHRRQGVLTKAVAIYETFLKEFPGDERTPDALLDLGRTLRDMGAYKLAINRFYSVINSTLKLPAGSFDRYQQLAKTAQFEIAETHFQAGEYEEAAKFFSRLKLLDLAPADQARAQFKAAYSLNLLGDNEAAITALRAYLVQNPQDENVPEARYLLAVSLRALQRPEDAFAVTLELLNAEKSLIGTDPKRWAYWQGRTGNQLANDFFQSGDTTHAAAIYAGLVELSPDPAWRLPIIYQVALCQERLGNLDRARDSYHAIIDGAGKTPTPDLAELARMAAWRLDHLDWTDQIGRKVARIFESTTGTAAIAPPPARPDPRPPMTELETIQAHHQLCDAIHECVLDENRFLRRHQRAPDQPLLERKRALLEKLDITLAALRAVPAGSARDPGVQAQLEKTRSRILQILQLDKENDQLLLRHSLAGPRPAAAANTPSSALLQKIYARCS